MTEGAPEGDAKDRITDEIRDAYRPADQRGGLGLKDDLIMALRFFSRLPTGDTPHEKPDLGRIAMALPFAALIMGIFPALILWLGAVAGLPAFFVATLAVASMVIVGGGMMEDSLADSADGLFGGFTRERRLDILKDSRHGTYGVAALCLFLVLRVTAIGSLVAINPLTAIGVWLAANVIGRSGGLYVSVALPQARDEGSSAAAGQLARSRFLVGLSLATLLLFVIGGPASSLLGVVTALMAVAMVVLGWTSLCRRLVGGQTGDLIGAAAGLGEIAALTALLIFV